MSFLKPISLLPKNAVISETKIFSVIDVVVIARPLPLFEERVRRDCQMFVCCVASDLFFRISKQKIYGL